MKHFHSNLEDNDFSGLCLSECYFWISKILDIASDEIERKVIMDCSHNRNLSGRVVIKKNGTRQKSEEKSFNSN